MEANTKKLEVDTIPMKENPKKMNSDTKKVEANTKKTKANSILMNRHPVFTKAKAVPGAAAWLRRALGGWRSLTSRVYKALW